MPSLSSSTPSTSPDSTILNAAFQTLLDRRTAPKTLCPSEVARSLKPSELNALGTGEWRDLMPRLREMAFEARERGEVQILQKGEVVEAGIGDVTGPIRIRRMVKD